MTRCRGVRSYINMAAKVTDHTANDGLHRWQEALMAKPASFRPSWSVERGNRTYHRLYQTMVGWSRLMFRISGCDDVLPWGRVDWSAWRLCSDCLVLMRRDGMDDRWGWSGDDDYNLMRLGSVQSIAGSTNSLAGINGATLILHKQASSNILSK